MYRGFALKEVFLETTHACNQRCRYCYLPDVGRSFKDELTTDEYKHLIIKLANEAKTVYLTFTGGEFFSRPDAIELLQAAEENNFCFSILTNGTLIDERTADALKEVMPFKIRVTLFAPDEDIHDNFTRLKGSYRSAVNGIRFLSERGIPVSITYPITSIANIEHFKAMGDLANSMGAVLEIGDRILPSRDKTCRKSILSYQLSQESYPLLNKWAEDYLRERNDCYLSEKDLEEKNRERLEKSITRLPCGAGVDTLAINPVGDIAACPMFLSEKIIGNIRKDDIIRLWDEAPFLKTLRSYDPAKRDKACKTCGVQDTCHVCVAQSYIENKDIYAPSIALCEEAKWMKEVKEYEKTLH